MEHPARVIAEITGCTAVQTEAVIKALTGKGWTPPAPASTAPPPAEDVGRPPRYRWTTCPPEASLTVHTDGARSGNPGPGGWSVVFDLDGTVVAKFSGSEDRATNNRMELTAVREAIRRAPVQARLEIVTDSQVVIGH